ncbi:g10099 [Coccomyxa elongata]
MVITHAGWCHGLRKSDQNESLKHHCPPHADNCLVVACEVNIDLGENRDGKLFHRSRILTASYPTTNATSIFLGDPSPIKCSTRPVNAACPGGTTAGTSCGCSELYDPCGEMKYV